MNNSYQLTSRGQEVLEQLAVVLPQIDKLLSGEEFDPSKEAAEFQITAADSLAHLYAPHLARRHEKTPNLVFVFHTYSEARYREFENGSRTWFSTRASKCCPRVSRKKSSSKTQRSVP